MIHNHAVQPLLTTMKCKSKVANEAACFSDTDITCFKHWNTIIIVHRIIFKF